MAKKKKANVCYEPCNGFAWTLLIVGVLYLLVDLKYKGFTFFGIQWWTALFILVGAHVLFCKCKG